MIKINIVDKQKIEEKKKYMYELYFIRLISVIFIFVFWVGVIRKDYFIIFFYGLAIVLTFIAERYILKKLGVFEK